MTDYIVKTNDEGTYANLIYKDMAIAVLPPSDLGEAARVLAEAAGLLITSEQDEAKRLQDLRFAKAEGQRMVEVNLRSNLTDMVNEDQIDRNLASDILMLMGLDPLSKKWDVTVTSSEGDVLFVVEGIEGDDESDAYDEVRSNMSVSVSVTAEYSGEAGYNSGEYQSYNFDMDDIGIEMSAEEA